jgi:hypothetical protein
VSGRDEAAFQGSVIGSQIIAPSERISHYADFRGVTQSNADGYTIASGQSLTVQNGSWEIKNGLLRNTSTPAVITFPQPTLGTSFVSQIFIPSSSDGGPGGDQGIIGYYKDIDNYFYTSMKNLSKLAGVEKDGGTFTELNTGNPPSSRKFGSRITMEWSEGSSGGDSRTMTFGGYSIFPGSPTLNTSSRSTQGFVSQNSTLRIEGFVVFDPYAT